MALQSGLGIWLFTSPTTASYPLIIQDYSEALMALSMTTVAPGGFGQLTAQVNIANGRIPRAEMSLFSRVAVIGFTGRFSLAVWLGELTDPEQSMSANQSEMVRITALGYGNILRDDPLSLAYSNQTGKQIITDQYTRRSAYLPTISSDLSAVFPDNPAATFAPVYDSRTMEEVIADVCTLEGDYEWGTWAHPTAVDQAGFPLGQLVIQQRDYSTTHYMATLAAREVTDYHITPSAERAYNVVEVGYNAGNSGYGRAIWTDPRLNGDGSQGAAPFRRRKYVRDLSSITTVGASQAQTIANTYGAQYSDPTKIDKTQLTLGAVRDGNGNPLPLWAVQAARNIYVPDLAVRGSQLDLAPVPGVTQFYIRQTTYTERQGGAMSLQIQGDNYLDSANLQIARLQNQSDLKARGGKTTGIFQIQGAAETGRCGVEWSAATTGNPIGTTVNFRTIMVQAPTSITLSADATGNYNASSPSVSNIDVHGFHFFVTCNFTGGNQWGQWHGQYQTNGNTIRALDEAAGTLDWHCDRCDTVHIGLAIKEHIRARVHPVAGNVPGHTALAIDCPRCGMTECFNTNLTQEDEDQQRPGNYLHRATQARLIRRLMRHPQVGLEIRR